MGFAFSSASGRERNVAFLVTQQLNIVACPTDCLHVQVVGGSKTPDPVRLFDNVIECLARSIGGATREECVGEGRNRRDCLPFHSLRVFLL